MSGDVQPRKRKDKKRKKDEISIEEPRGTAAALGDGDVFMHSPDEHGTGGHWCAKIIFFGLLAVLITLIGLIILENRGLSELEANSIESRYAGVLEGWIEDIPEDGHHDEHTLELKHQDSQKLGAYNIPNDLKESEIHYKEEDNEDHYDSNLDIENNEDISNENVAEANDEDEEESEEVEQEVEVGKQSFFNYFQQSNDNEQEEIDQNDVDDNDEVESSNEDLEDNEDNSNEAEDNDEEEESEEVEQEVEVEKNSFFNYFQQNYDNDQDERNQNDVDNNDEAESSNEDLESTELDNDYIKDDEAEEDDDHDEEEHDDEPEIDIEKIEKEIDEEPISTELPALPEDDDDEDDDNKEDSENDNDSDEADGDDDNDNDHQNDDSREDDDDDDFLENDDSNEVPLEKITAPSGKPFDEFDDEDISTEKPRDTLEDEEEYEQQQEQLRKEQEEASHIWLKLIVGGALVVAAHAIVRRATHTPTSENADENEENEDIEEIPIADRRMTLITHEPPIAASSSIKHQESYRSVIPESVVKRIPLVIKSAPTPKQMSVEEEQQEFEEEEPIDNDEENKEQYSDEEEIEEPQVIKNVKSNTQTAPSAKSVHILEEKADDEDADDDIGDDVEIIDEEQLDEEVIEEEIDEEEISDVDDTELLSRLEAKYGRLPEPERFGPKPKDGGNSFSNEWPGEPSDAYWRQQLDKAERDLEQGSWKAAMDGASSKDLSTSCRARYIIAASLDMGAEKQRDNKMLTRAITAYLEVLKMNEGMSDEKLIEVTKRTLDRIKFRGAYLNAEPVYRLLIRRFPNEPAYRNNLTISYLMANRVDLAENVLKETLKMWPKDRVALAHYGFVLKTNNNRYEKAVDAFKKALDGDEPGPANEPRFYYHYGDSLLLLGRNKEAHEVHVRGAALGHFLSPAQRSLYNVPRLKSHPWWNIDETPYSKLAKALESSWREILQEGEAAKKLYEEEKEGLREKGEWSQLDLFVRGTEVSGRCSKAPVTCRIVRSEPAAAKCRRGQIKFSLIHPGTHVRPHVGPTNCRLRMHLGLSNTSDTFLRVDNEIRQWQVGRTFMFDDSFEHEVWHNGTAPRLVLIVDLWHPDLTAQERAQLPAI